MKKEVRKFYGATVVRRVEGSNAFIKIEGDWLVAYEKVEIKGRKESFYGANWETCFSDPRIPIKDAIGFCIRECMASTVYISETDVKKIESRYGRGIRLEKEMAKPKKGNVVQECVFKVKNMFA